MTRKRWPVELKDRLLAEQGHTCCVCHEHCSFEQFATLSGTKGCGRYYPTFEHKIPLWQGGADELENLGVSHSGCNNDRNRQ